MNTLDSEPNQSKTPQTGENSPLSPAPSFTGSGLSRFVRGLAIVLGSSLFAFALGLKLGSRTPLGENPIAILFGLLLLIVQCLLLLRVCKRLMNRNPFIYLSILIMIEPLKLFCFYDGGREYAGGQVRSMMTQERANLRNLAIALESYAIDWHSYPAQLQQLTAVKDLILVKGRVIETDPYLDSLFRPVFGDSLYPEYATYTPSGAPYSTFWLLWSPGPSGQYSITPGPQLQTELSIMASGKPPGPWLLERLYDPTNGSGQGDIARWKQ